jgi:hypothetical protein
LISSVRRTAQPALPASLLIHALYCCILSSTSAYGATVIETENARPGDPGWVLTDPALHEIEGYASATSINRGETIRFFISTDDPAYTIGWVGTEEPGHGW